MAKREALIRIEQSPFAGVGAIGASVGGGGGGSASAHALSDTTVHIGPLARSQAPWVEDDINSAIAQHTGIPNAHHNPVTPGAGIAVFNQAVSVNLAPHSGLIAAEHLRMGTPASVTSTTSNSVTGDTHTHTVVAHVNAKNNPGHLVKSDADGRVVFSRVTTDQLWSDGILNFTPGSRIELTAGKEIRTTDSITGFLGSGWRMTNIDGFGFLDIRKIQVEELHAYAFVADIERVRVGETFVTQSMGVLAADMIIPAINNSTTMIVENVPFFPGEIFANNEWVLLQLIDRSGGGLIIARSWGQVSNYAPVGDDRQSWTYTHRSGVSGLHYKIGSYVLSFGKPGDGYIHQSVIDSGGSPYTRYATWSGANPYTPANRTIHVQVGNLDSITDTALNPTGFGLYGTNVFLKGSLLAADGDVRILKDDGINLKVLQAPNPFTSNISIEWWHDLDNRTIRPATEMYAWTLFNAGAGEYATNFSLQSWGYQGGPSGLTLGAIGSVSSELGAYVSLGSPSQSGGSAISILADTITLGRHLVDGEIQLYNKAVTKHLYPLTDLTYDLGTGARRYRAIYVNQLNAGTISGETLSGAEWEFGGSMTIDANAGTHTLVTITNQGAGRADLFVDRDITLGGLVDGVDVGSMGASYFAHITNSNAHHAQVHVLANASGLGADHTVSGLTTGHVLRATANNAARFMALNHTDLAGVNPDQHHNQVHILATNTALGPDHTISGGVAGWVLRATGSTAARIMQLSHDDLGGVTPNQHHAQVHNIVGSDHTISGSQFQLVGATGANQLGLLTPSANPGAGPAILRTGNSGELTLRSLTVQGNVDITSGGDLTVGNNVFFVDVSGFNVGINRAPDPQFDLDVLGNVRSGGWFVGRHAIQIDGAHMICHFDGGQPYATNHTGDPTGHMGQVADVIGPVVYRPGKFGTKAIQVGEGTTNLLLNPSFEGTYSGAGIAPNWSAYTTGSASGSRSSSGFALYGDLAQRITRTGGAAADVYGVQCTISSVAGTVMAGSVRIKVLSYSPGARVTMRVFRSSGQEILVTRILTDADLNQWVDLLGSVATSSASTSRVFYVYIHQANADILVDAAQLELKAYPTAYCDGSLPGHTWAGTPNASASSRLNAAVYWHDIGGGLSIDHWTLMFWVYSYGAYGVTDNLHTVNLSDGSDDNRMFLYHNTAAPGSFRVGYTTGGSTTFSNMSGNVMEAGRWHHVVAVYGGGTLTFYLDGVQVSSSSRAPVQTPLSRLAIGARYISPLNHGPTSLLDDIVLVDRVVPAAEVRAIYESNAPVFAESSTHQFRVGNGLVWGDAEGLFARDVDGNAIFAVVGVDGKSWGGVTLDKGDLLIGNAAAGYIQYDRSAQQIGLVDTQLQMNAGGVKFLEISSSNGISLVAYETAAQSAPNSYSLTWHRTTTGGTRVAQIANFIAATGNLNTAGTYVAVDSEATNVGPAHVWLQAKPIIGGQTAALLLKSSGSGVNSIAHIEASEIALYGVTGSSTYIGQISTTGTKPGLIIEQADLSEQFIDFQSTVGASNAISTAALGTYHGKVRVSLNGVFKWLAVYN